MAERAAHVVDHVLPPVPVRQWVLTLPHRLRYRLAWDHDLCRAVVGVSVRTVLGFLRHVAREAGVGDAPVLAGIAAASVQGTFALGARAGRPVRRCGAAPEQDEPPARVRCHARQEGFDLHAGVRVRADERDRLERLCRYVLRPPVAQDRLHLTAEGQVLLQLRHPWSDGTTHLLFDPLELLERLAVLPFDSAQGTPSAVEG